MRVCRYEVSGTETFGFYLNDEQVIDFSEVASQRGEQPRGEQHSPINTLLDLLPGGNQHPRATALFGSITPELVQQSARAISSVKLLTPLARPGKFLCLAGNYPQHVAEQGGQVEERARTVPYLFLKPDNTFTHPFDPIVIPESSPHQIDWEVELGVVIGKTCSKVSEEEAMSYVAGYTVVNDITDRGHLPNPGRTKRPRDTFFDWQHGKWHDTFCPWGPCFLAAEETIDPQNFHLKLHLNDTTEQDASTAEMVFPVAAIIEFVSEFVTLSPGDIISTGTPSGVGKAKGKFLKRGDQLIATIDGIGVLQNPVR
ncbi:fumarylacetoacetate hydrolase family protein [Planctomicrobium sp. SH668]|uniref:fumarylacetoacetate hydrolase family protein n=1 Tax=Planctomicrobium sp. SH668 TaxID=3448126 RepID=UPI003F5C4063